LELEIKNREFLEYIKRQGGVISIGDFYQIKGCCNALKMPSGRLVSPNKMFNPKSVDDYYMFSLQGITVFIEKELVMDIDEIEFLIISTARYKIVKNKDKMIIY